MAVLKVERGGTPGIKKLMRTYLRRKAAESKVAAIRYEEEIISGGPELNKPVGLAWAEYLRRESAQCRRVTFPQQK